MLDSLLANVSVQGAPLFMRSDNGPEFVSHAILEWIAQSGIATALSDPGKAWQNGADECFNGKFRDECLSLEWFRSRREAAVIIEAWRRHYNAIRPQQLELLDPTRVQAATSTHPNRSRFMGMNGSKKRAGQGLRIRRLGRQA